MTYDSITNLGMEIFEFTQFKVSGYTQFKAEFMFHLLYFLFQGLETINKNFWPIIHITSLSMEKFEFTHFKVSVYNKFEMVLCRVEFTVYLLCFIFQDLETKYLHVWSYDSITNLGFEKLNFPISKSRFITNLKWFWVE